MRRSRFLPAFSYLLISLVAFSCSKSGAPSEPDDGPGVLKGQVTDAQNPSQNLGGVTVRIEGTDYTAVTADDGSFEFAGLEDGDYTIVVDPAGDAPYFDNRIEVSVHRGATTRVDVTMLPRDAVVGEFGIYPAEARVGLLESVQFYAGGMFAEEDGSYPTIAFRPTWSIRSSTPIGVISREGIFIGTAVGSGEIVASFSDSIRAVAKIHVVADNDVARIVVIPSWGFSIGSGTTRYLAAWAISGAGNPAPGTALVWSVDPGAIGAITAANDLTAEEREQALAWLMQEGWIDYGAPTDEGGGGVIGIAGDSVAGGTGTNPVPPNGGPPETIDPDVVSLVRFTAGAAPGGEVRGEIHVGPAAGDWTTSVEVVVYDRGVLTSVDLRPEESSFTVGGGGYFFARGLNEWGRAMDGLAFEWTIDPSALGAIDPIEIPWMGPNGGDPTGQGTGEDSSGGGWSDPMPGPGGGDDPDMPMPPIDGPMLWFEGGAWLRADAVGDGQVRVRVTDAMTHASIEKSVPVTIEPAPTIETVEIEPNPIEAAPGDSVFLRAIAYDSNGDMMWGGDVAWELIGNIGTLVPYDGPYDAEYDSLGGRPGDPTDPGTTPPDRWGLSTAVFFGTVPGASGTVRATVTSAAGESMMGEADVRVLGAAR